jgi:hypothetical protein
MLSFILMVESSTRGDLFIQQLSRDTPFHLSCRDGGEQTRENQKGTSKRRDRETEMIEKKFAREIITKNISGHEAGAK